MPDVEETGDTLEDNARLKAVALCDATGLPGGRRRHRPRGRRARRRARRVLGPVTRASDATYADNVAKLLDELARRRPGRRAPPASRTVALARWPDGREVAADGDGRGHDRAASRGATAGFGYDPVFVPDEGDGRTFAEMAAGEKHALSHRGRAFRTLADGLKIVDGPVGGAGAER